MKTKNNSVDLHDCNQDRLPNQRVKVGQVWDSNDYRHPERSVAVLWVGKTHAVCKSSRNTVTTIRLDRFYPTSTGYKLDATKSMGSDLELLAQRIATSAEEFRISRAKCIAIVAKDSKLPKPVLGMAANKGNMVSTCTGAPIPPAESGEKQSGS
jgi:hypothetical protein